MGAAISETRRLILREMDLGDTDALAAVLSDPETMRFYPHPFSRDEVVAWIQRQMAHYSDRGYGLWGLVLKETGELIGNCGPLPQTIEGVDEVELGWHVNRRHWRRGYASEAATAARDLGFERFGLERLVSLILPANEPSQGVARKIGMVPEKTVRYGRDNWVHLLYVIHKREVSGLVDPVPDP